MYRSSFQFQLIKLNLFFGVGFFFLLTGCAKQNDSAQQAEATAVQEEETEVAMAAASPEPGGEGSVARCPSELAKDLVSRLLKLEPME